MGCSGSCCGRTDGDNPTAQGYTPINTPLGHREYVLDHHKLVCGTAPTAAAVAPPAAPDARRSSNSSLQTTLLPAANTTVTTAPATAPAPATSVVSAATNAAAAAATSSSGGTAPAATVTVGGAAVGVSADGAVTISIAAPQPQPQPQPQAQAQSQPQSELPPQPQPEASHVAVSSVPATGAMFRIRWSAAKPAAAAAHPLCRVTPIPRAATIRPVQSITTFRAGRIGSCIRPFMSTSSAYAGTATGARRAASGAIRPVEVGAPVRIEGSIKKVSFWDAAKGFGALQVAVDESERISTVHAPVTPMQKAGEEPVVPTPGTDATSAATPDLPASKPKKGRPKKVPAKPITVIVNSMSTQPVSGQSIVVDGHWSMHEIWGPQLRATRVVSVSAPTSRTAVAKYLSSVVDGVGEKLAHRIVDHFGAAEAMKIIESQPERLTEVEGIKRGLQQRIETSFKEHASSRETVLFLQQFGLSPTITMRVHEKYKLNSQKVLIANPYVIMTDIEHAGFATADKIARQLEFPPNDPLRVKAAVMSTLTAASEGKGHCFLPPNELISDTIQLVRTRTFDPEASDILPLIHELSVEKKLVIESVADGDAAAAATATAAASDSGAAAPAPNLAYYSAEYHYYESAVARHVRALLGLPAGAESDTSLPHSFQQTRSARLKDRSALETWLTKYETESSVRLSPEQKSAVLLAATSGVSIVTGGPGVGKTFALQTLIKCWKQFGIRFELCSPTGRGANRMSELTGERAFTIHRLLQSRFGRSASGQVGPNAAFRYGEAEPLDTDAVVVDEASMLDLQLMHSLIRAIRPGGQLVLVGDIDQLPSVGPGLVLSDLIASGRVPVARLTQVFRQAERSAIVTHSHAINRGVLPTFEAASLNPVSDCLLLETTDTASAIAHVVQELLPSLGYNPVNQLQVLAPMWNGASGIRELNVQLQALLNPVSSTDSAKNAPAAESGFTAFRMGDRVMQTVNNYEKDVFNGELGVIVAVPGSDKLPTPPSAHHISDPEAAALAAVTAGRKLSPGWKRKKLADANGGRLPDSDKAKKGGLIVRYTESNGRTYDIPYEANEYDQLQIAYAITVHKSQGSEYDVCVLVLQREHHLMLARSLFYTALTRGKKLVILISTPRVLATAVSTAELLASRGVRRHSLLASRIGRPEAITRIVTPPPLTSTYRSRAAIVAPPTDSAASTIVSTEITDPAELDALPRE